MILTDLDIDPRDLAESTGWELKPEGLCRADRCVPMPDHEGDTLDARYVAERLDAPLLHDEDHDLWALGPSTGGRALDSAELPEIILPDIRTGEDFDFRDLRGQRALLIAWASW